ncbi:MAG: ParB/RepB/Spo0J family partition protein [Phycisphaerae bacterium]|nr:MAG: ParB/RepB/Spo0J family partition protein [Planctomycetota bacterium]MBE7456089.1 ParB/RepB/Spo0J family partition protein [Planctomycetia bacterium]MCL4718607.1 ParB/RepB/Spo0J family partition protein [Phycisphaerae bacterium]MCQ3921273.1 hypothetical protein [Planctomycetota bacterium]
MSTPRIELVPIDRLVCRPQVREHFDDEALLALAMTMKAVGIRQPIAVRRAGDVYEIITGERRWRAAKLAGLTTIPAMIVEGELSEADIIELQLIEDCRQDLNPIEKATGYDRWMKATQRPAGEIARITGTSPAAVSKLTSVLLLPPDILARVREGRIPYSSAYELVKIADAAEQRRLAEAVACGGLSRVGLIEQAKAHEKTPGKGREIRRVRTPRERVSIPLGEGRSVSVSAPTLSVESLIAWFADLAERIRSAGADGRPLAEVIKSISGNGK